LTTVAIRTLEPGDRPAVLDLVRRAFATGGRDGKEEADIVRDTWALRTGSSVIDLVAEIGAGLAGHIIGAQGDLAGQAVPGIAPVSVVPEHQGEGVGSALMQAWLELASARGWPAVLILGDPAYYGRFGFIPAAEHGVSYASFGRQDPHFQVKILDPSRPVTGGAYHYCWELGRPGAAEPGRDG